MNLLVLLCAVIQFAWAKPGSTSAQQLIQEINSMKTTWRAGVNFIEETPAEFLAHRVGFLELHPDPDYHVEVKTHKLDKAAIPERFDARDQWPSCRDVIDNIRDQGYCAGGWAFSSAEVMSDRLCIFTEGKIKFQFSPQDILSCCTYCGFGCGGGYTYTTWSFWEQSGIVSGGDYNSNEGCKPFDSLSYNNNTTPACNTTCQTNYEIPYSDDKRFGGSHYMVQADAQQIQTEIMTNGPVQASMRVYDDFVVYEDGIYQHVTGEDQGGHAVKIIGWGIENDVPYWLVANSIGTEWANLKGYFKIRRGFNESGIESNVIAGKPYIPTDDPGPGDSAIKVVSSGFGLFLVGLMFFFY